MMNLFFVVAMAPVPVPAQHPIDAVLFNKELMVGLPEKQVKIVPFVRKNSGMVNDNYLQNLPQPEVLQNLPQPEVFVQDKYKRRGFRNH